MRIDRTDRRDRVMTALGAAEHLVSASPHAPSSVEVAQDAHFPPGVVGVDLHFSRDPKALAAFAEAMDAPVSQVPGEFAEVEFTDDVTSGDLDGVPWRAWARTYAPVPAADAHLRECQLTEQHHQTDDPAEPDPAAYIAVVPLAKSPQAVTA